MGFRFKKSVKIAPGVKLNFGKKSTSVTFGGKGVRYTVSSTGRKTKSVSIPGTGLSYSESTTAKKSCLDRTTKACPSEYNTTKAVREYSPKAYRKTGIILIVIAALTLLIGLLTVSVGGWIFLILGATILFLGISYAKMSKSKKNKENLL